jgi:hypothetical protein
MLLDNGRRLEVVNGNGTLPASAPRGTIAALSVEHIIQLRRGQIIVTTLDKRSLKKT